MAGGYVHAASICATGWAQQAPISTCPRANGQPACTRAENFKMSRLWSETAARSSSFVYQYWSCYGAGWKSKAGHIVRLFAPMWRAWRRRASRVWGIHGRRSFGVSAEENDDGAASTERQAGARFSGTDFQLVRGRHSRSSALVTQCQHSIFQPDQGTLLPRMKH